MLQFSAKNLFLFKLKKVFYLKGKKYSLMLIFYQECERNVNFKNLLYKNVKTFFWFLPLLVDSDNENFSDFEWSIINDRESWENSGGAG